jgi:ApbE superfamily uncharacterized protein (UPF0280 family)
MRLGVDRWHLQHGPIDLIIGVDADEDAALGAMRDCWTLFPTVLPALVAELGVLRRAVSRRTVAHGPVARRMVRACVPHAELRFITPMAAVAGAVADELIGCFMRPGVRRAFINNGGDIAVHLTPGTDYRIGILADLERAAGHRGADLDRVFRLEHTMPVRGIATSGWRGRSFSLGIADSVTVLAADAAAADAAATLIANAVDCDHPGIVRAPADRLKDDTDLGSRLVTVQVPTLSAAAKALAVSRGRAEAERLGDCGCIHAAAIFLQGTTEVVMPRSAALRPRLAFGATG